MRKLLGIWTEEFDSLPPEDQNSFVFEGREYPASLCFAISHPEGAKVLASYEKDFYAGTPVVTRNTFGKGRAYYVGTRSSRGFYHALIKKLAVSAGLLSKKAGELPEGVELAVRENRNGRFVFLINHGGEEVSLKDLGSGLPFPKKLPPYGVSLIRVSGKDKERLIKK